MKLKYKQKKKSSNVQFQETTADHQSDHKMAPKERVSFDCECVSECPCVYVYACVCYFPWYNSLCVYVFVIYFIFACVCVCTCARAPPDTYRDACRDTEGHVNTNTHI